MALRKNLKLLTQFKKQSTAQINGYEYAGSSSPFFQITDRSTHSSPGI